MKKAFSLIELLIVIMIIGVVYTLSISSFAKLSDDSLNLSLVNLKEYLQKIPRAKSVKLLCLDDCSECDIFVDGVKSRGVEGFLDRGIRIYRYEFAYGFTEVEKEVYFNIDDVEEDVCFSYEVDKNGVGEQVLVEFEDNFYDFSTYFSKTAVYHSMQDATEVREARISEVMR